MKRWLLAAVIVVIPLAAWLGLRVETDRRVHPTIQMDGTANADVIRPSAIELEDEVESDPEPLSPTRAAIDGDASRSGADASASRDGIEFVVRGSNGGRIFGAIARTVGEPSIESAPTDASGHGRLPSTSGELRFLALGYRSATARVTAEDEAFQVTLERLPELDLVVERRDRIAPTGLTAKLWFTETSPFVGEEGDGSLAVQRSLGAPIPSEREVHSHPDRPPADGILLRFAYKVGSNGRLRIPGLAPTRSVQLRIEDRTGSALTVHELSPSVFHSHSPYVITIDQSSRTLEVRVVDEARQPVSGARIRSRANGERLARTRFDGVARITDLYASPIDLGIEPPVHLPVRLRGLVLESAYERREVVVVRGRSIRVHVVDAVGAALSAEEVTARMGDERVGKPRRCDNDDCFRIDELPAGTVTLLAQVRGTYFPWRHDTNDPDAVIVIPDHGVLVVELTQPFGFPTEVTVSLSPEPELDGTPPRAVPGARRQVLGSELDIPMVLDGMLPGRYTVEVSLWDRSDVPIRRSATIPGVVIRRHEETIVRCALDESN